jgi:hypothetical protein
MTSGCSGLPSTWSQLGTGPADAMEVLRQIRGVRDDLMLLGDHGVHGQRAAFVSDPSRGGSLLR